MEKGGTCRRKREGGEKEVGRERERSMLRPLL